MEQLLTIAQNITTIFGAIISILALIVLVYLIVLSAKFNRLMKQINSTAESVQQLSMLPLNALTTILNRLL
jgi:flagellar biogenesis protein FliO